VGAGELNAELGSSAQKRTLARAGRIGHVGAGENEKTSGEKKREEGGGEKER